MANFKPARIERQNAEPLSDLLSRFVEANGLAPGLLRQAVFSAWDQASGAAAHTISKYVRDNVLYVTISSSVVRSGLVRSSDHILKKINMILKSDPTLSSLGICGEIKALKMK